MGERIVNEFLAVNTMSWWADQTALRGFPFGAHSPLPDRWLDPTLGTNPTRGHQVSQEVSVLDSKGLSADLLPDGEIAVLASGDVTVMVRGKDSRIEMDGRLKSAIPLGNDRMFIVDLARSTGFHAITVDGLRTYRFATVDAKAKLEGVRDMLSVLQREGLSWGGQLFFADGEGLPDNRMLARWLQVEGTSAATVLEDIAVRPSTRSRQVIEASSVARPPFDVAGSLALYRRSPETLEERVDGAIQVGSRRFTPRKVFSRQQSEALDTPPNRRAAALATMAFRITSTLRDLAPVEMVAGIEELRKRFERIVAMPLYRDRNQTLKPLSEAPYPEELSDHRYSAVLRYYRQLSNMPGWNPSLLGTAETFVRHSDEIYQAFVACMIAEGFGMQRTVEELRPHAKHPSFESDDYVMWYDTRPPFLASWRGGTVLPDEPRPDVVILDRKDGRFALLDAKYRVKAGSPTNDSLTEVQYYLNTYGLRMAAIAYPSTGAPMEADAQGNRLVALPITPVGDILDVIRSQYVPLLKSLMQSAPW